MKRIVMLQKLQLIELKAERIREELDELLEDYQELYFALEELTEETNNHSHG